MSKVKLTPEQKEQSKKMCKPFIITSVCRNDLKNIENSTGNRRFSDEFLLSITDEQMKAIAELMELEYVKEDGNDFWYSLESCSDRIIFKDWNRQRVAEEMIAFKFPDGINYLPESEYIHIENELSNDVSEGVLEYFNFDSKRNTPIPNFGKWILIN